MGARLWQLGPHNGIYLFMWAEILILQLLRILCGPQDDPAENSPIFQYLSRSPVNETIRSKTQTPTQFFPSMRAALDSASAEHKEHLLVTSDARLSADRCSAKPAYIQEAYRALCELAILAKRVSAGQPLGQSRGQWLRYRGCDYAESDSPEKEAALTAKCCGHDIVCWEHLRLGTSFNECGRIHFSICECCSKCVIQHCGDHL